MGRINIREFTPDDTERVDALYRLAAAGTELPPELDEFLDQREVQQRFVAETAGRVVGHGMISYPTSNTGEKWGLDLSEFPGLEIGGTFVAPMSADDRFDVWHQLFTSRLLEAQHRRLPMLSRVWSNSAKITETIRELGGLRIGERQFGARSLHLYMFNNYVRQ